MSRKPRVKSKRPIDDLLAGEAFRNSLIPRADAYAGPYPLWHGWVIMDAFLAGIDYANKKTRRPAHRQER